MDDRNGTLLGQYRNLHQARVGLKNAAERLEEFLPGDSRGAARSASYSETMEQAA